MLLKLTDWFVYTVLNLNPEKSFTEVIHFFIYDAVKILLMIYILIFAIGVIRTFLPQERIRRWMIRGKGLGNVFGALFGALTPFCSCSSIPIFYGFLKAGVPLGITFSFLITSPLINEYLVVLMLGFFGWKIAVAYVLSGLLIGVTAGMILGAMKLERFLVEDFNLNGNDALEEPAYSGFRSRIVYGLDEAHSIFSKIWLWVLGGVAAGALIHNYVPQEWIHDVVSKTGVFSVPIAVVLGVPMYGSCAAIVPIAVVLFQKGMPLGTALALMMAIAALSLPEAIMLRRAMRLHLILIFFGVTTAAIIITGYVFNVLQPILS